MLYYVHILNVVMKSVFIQSFMIENSDGGNEDKWNKDCMAFELLYRYVGIGVGGVNVLSV